MRSILRVSHRDLALLGALTILVVAFGAMVARDVRLFEEDARRLQERLAQGFELIDELQFETQEVRRILLYALHTSDANRQLEYADQSRAADARVQRLLADRRELFLASGTRVALENLDRSWRQYLVVRDEVIGLILEGSLPEGVALDEERGTARFNDVRRAIVSVKSGFESYAAGQVGEAGTRANRAMLRLALLVASAVCAAAIGIYLVHRRATLEALLRSEAHKGSILQAVPDPIISLDDGGCIIELNDAAERTFGISRAAALGARMDDLVLAAEARGVMSTLLSPDRRRVRSAAARVETVGARQDGTTFPMELVAVHHIVGRDRVWTVHLSDLTERRHAEEQLRRAKEAAEVATEAKSEFLATMSHELRTPLSGVIGIAELLQADKPLASQRELIRMLRSAATALLGLVSDILDYSRIEAGQTELIPVAFSIRQCVEDAFDPITDLAARKKLEIGAVIDPDVPAWVVADQDRVRQVLLNLLSNAVKFTDAGEVAVHVTAKAGPHDSVAISIRVCDTGHGIPAHLHEQLFRRFSRIDPAPAPRQGGAGLGLPIAQSLSRLLGGSLTVESAAGHGSTFTMVFSAGLAAGRPLKDPLDGSLAGITVQALLGPGIVGRQIRSLLCRWDVRVVGETDPGDSPPAPVDGRVDAIVVDADALAGRLPQEALTTQPTETGRRVPVIAVTRLRTAGTATFDASDPVVATPVRAQALHEAICLATGAASRSDTADDLRRSPAFPPGALEILLVDDNDANRRVIRLMLEELGVHVDDVASGLEAIACARSHAYDVVFMDVRMPELDGLETTRRIRATQHGAGARPVVLALTANVMQGEEERCRTAGMDGYLAKPLRLETLAAVLDPLVARKTAQAVLSSAPHPAPPPQQPTPGSAIDKT